MPQSKPPSLWYKDAIIYELHVKAFRDSNGDGRGDFRGLAEKLDYLQELGVTAVWILPFYPSPQRDDGYDIADFRGVHPDYGSLRDFKAFVREAHRRGLKVITELVVNHTSDQHPWFQAARRAPKGSAKRRMYVWSDTDEALAGTRIIFTDTERSNWTWDAVAGQYYWHRFFHHQPDLNHNDPRVVREVTRVLRFWLDMGVDGLRLDAVPYLCVREGTSNENLPETHEVIRKLRAAVDAHYDDRMLLAEANQWPDDVRPYFGDSDECHMAFHFPLMPRIYMALSREDRRPITEILDRTPSIPSDCQWALFLRNHDELTLEMVTDEERDYMYREYATDPRMRVNVGIRRRLAPLLDNDRRRIEMLHALLFSFPGTPVIYYGDEIGMGDNIFLGDRDGVRTPMQWSIDRNAGFSQADPARLFLPVIMDPVYGYQAVNVEAQQRSPHSLLNAMKRLIALRRQHKAFGRGSIDFLRPRNRRILAYLRRWRGEVILCVANLSRTVQPVELDLGEFDGWTPLEILGHTTFPRIGALPYFLTLAPYGFYWFRLEPAPEPIHIQRRADEHRTELPRVGLEGMEDLDDLFRDPHRYTLAQDVLGAFLPRQRWFAGKAREISSIQVVDHAKLGGRLWIALARVSYADGGEETYVLPLQVADEKEAARVAEDFPDRLLARIRTSDGEGLLYDALADRTACAALLAAMADQRTFSTGERCELRAAAVGSFARIQGQEVAAAAPIRHLGVEQSNTSVVVGDAYILKIFRRLEEGPNPDLEIGRHLTENSGFDRIAPVAGSLSYHGRKVQGGTVAMLQDYVPNQGDGWKWFLERLRGEDVDRAVAAALELGRTTARLHRALGVPTRRREFRPEPLRRGELESLADDFARRAQETLDRLNGRIGLLPERWQAPAQRLLAASTVLQQRFRGIGRLEHAGQKIRVHGDYHLGQVLVDGQEGFIVLDFEGEPLRSLRERRAKASPLKDVAGMLRSFHYAASTVVGEGEESMERRGRLDGLLKQVTDAFLNAWLQESDDAAWLPAPRELPVLLDAFVLDKAFYELDYELNNRPQWVGIPLEGILAVAGPPEPKEGRP